MSFSSALAASISALAASSLGLAWRHAARARGLTSFSYTSAALARVRGSRAMCLAACHNSLRNRSIGRPHQ